MFAEGDRIQGKTQVWSHSSFRWEMINGGLYNVIFEGYLLTKSTLQNKWHSLFCTGKPSKNGSFYEEHKDDPTIFVGAAHCNFVCKDFTDRDHPVALETCCCLPKELSTSCVRGSEVGYNEP